MNQHSDEVQFLAALLPLNERGLSCHACITYCINANCINLCRCLPLRLMNYKDALNVTISLDNKKLTRAKLVEIANTLQDRCLLSELDKPTLISFNSYIKDISSRWDIHQRETRALVKDVINLGRSTRQILANAMDRL